jgi:hypothetical protein
MAKKGGKDGITEKHFISLSEVAGGPSTICVYGKIIRNADVQPGASEIVHPSGADEPLQLAQVVGYLDQGQCIRLAKPCVIAMPKADGPADGCDWNPEQYVVWRNLPKNWVTLHVQFRTANLHGVLSSAVQIEEKPKLRADQVIEIFAKCIPLAGGNKNEIDLSRILQFYSLDKDSVLVFASDVIGSTDYGVKRYHFVLPAGALDGISVSSKLGDLATTIRAQAVPE